MNSNRVPKFDKTINYDETTGEIKDYCTDRGFPLGGFGTGGFNILTDGGFAKFRTNHNWFRFVGATNFPKGTFFAVRTKNEDKISAKILRRSYQKGKEYQNIENINHTTFTGKIPRFNLKYSDEDLPINIELNGYTSIIPRNTKDSSLPVAFFSFEIKNPTNKEQEISLLFSFENLLGLGGSGGHHIMLPRDGPVAYRRRKGNYQEILKEENRCGIRFKTKQDYASKNPRRRTIGEYQIFSEFDQNSQTITHCECWNEKKSKPNLLKCFTETGHINTCKNDRKGHSGAICSNFNLKSGEIKKINFYVLWWTPFYVIEKNQRIKKYLGNHTGTDYGHYYLNYFKNPDELGQYCTQNRNRLEKESCELEDILKKSSFPTWLQNYILNSTDSMLINTLLTKDGSYYMIEGCPWDWIFGGLTGTIDQRLASHPYSSIFFPDIDLSELMIFKDLTKDGCVSHGDGHCDVALSSTDVPYGMAIKVFNKTEYWTDLPQSFILQVGKLIMITGNVSLLDETWQIMTEMADYLEKTYEDHIPDGITTYDYAYYKPHFIYSAILQLATLEMMIHLGEQLIKNTQDENLIKSILKRIESYQKQYESCDKSYQKLLWNEKGYFKTCSTKDTIFTSGLAGDWIARYSGLKPVVDYKKAKSHSEWQTKVLVDAYKFTDRDGEISRPRVYREATVNGEEIPVRIVLPKFNYANNPWQSLGYQAIESIYLNRVEAGMKLIKRIWEKGWYEGYPWNMNNWGFSSHIYMTHPVMWSTFNAFSGISLDKLTSTLKISPRQISEESILKVPVFFPDVWFMLIFNFEKKSGIIEVLKTFNAKNTTVIKKLIFEDVSGNRAYKELEEPFECKESKSIQFDYLF